MKMYPGLLLATATALSLAAAFSIANDLVESRVPDDSQRASEVASLRDRLAGELREQESLLETLERVLEVDFSARRDDLAALVSVLAGPDAPPPAPTAAVAPSQAAPPAPGRPWYEQYRVSMVYMAGGDQYAVVNGEVYMAGDTLGPDTVLRGVEEGAAVLVHKGEDRRFAIGSGLDG